MSWEAVLRVASPIVAAIISFILWKIFSGDRKKWRRIWLSRNIPMWLVARAYREWYSDKRNLPRRELIIKGAYYEYKVISKDKDMAEIRARVNNIVVYKKEPSRR